MHGQDRIRPYCFRPLCCVLAWHTPEKSHPPSVRPRTQSTFSSSLATVHDGQMVLTSACLERGHRWARS